MYTIELYTRSIRDMARGQKVRTTLVSPKVSPAGVWKTIICLGSATYELVRVCI